MPRPVLLLKTGTTFCILIEAIKTIDAQLRTLSGNPPSPVSFNPSSPSTIRFYPRAPTSTSNPSTCWTGRSEDYVPSSVSMLRMPRLLPV